jgi:hypothetical protein
LSSHVELFRLLARGATLVSWHQPWQDAHLLARPCISTLLVKSSQSQDNSFLLLLPHVHVHNDLTETREHWCQSTNNFLRNSVRLCLVLMEWPLCAEEPLPRFVGSWQDAMV